MITKSIKKFIGRIVDVDPLIEPVSDEIPPIKVQSLRLNVDEFDTIELQYQGDWYTIEETEDGIELREL